ncbi:MAG: HEAT repeat domain-containing protein, partial [Patescibacteria group bacterium]
MIEHPNHFNFSEIREKREEYPTEIKPSFCFCIDKERIDAIQMIKNEGEKIDSEKILELLKSDDFVKKNAGLYLLNKNFKIFFKETKNPEEILSILEKLIEDEDFDIKIEAISIYIKTIFEIKNSKGILLILEKLIEDKNWRVRQKIAIALNEQKNLEEFLLILEKLIEDKNRDVRLATIPICIKTIFETKNSEEILPRLKELIKDEDYIVKQEIAIALNEQEKSKEFLPILE